MSKAFISLGSNIGDKLGNLKSAVESLSLLPGTSVVKLSSVYETEPVGYKEQDNFFNMAAEIDTDLSPRALLGALLGIEAAMGRVRTIKNGPRIIDLDLLGFENEISNDSELILPHPRMSERAFVLVPLCEICGDKKYKEMLDKLTKIGVVKTAYQITGGK